MGEARLPIGDPGRESRWDEIERKLDAASEALSRQGSVASRRTPGGTCVYSIRFVAVEGGRRRQRALYLGADPALADRARAWIARSRERERWAREVEESARFATRSRALLCREPGPPRRPR